MNLKSLICILSVIVISCNDKKVSHTDTEKAAQDTTTQIASNQNAPTKIDIKDLGNLVGQKPTESKIFEMDHLGKRFEKLMGEHYAEFKSDWNQETPFMKDGEIIYFVGCKAPNCSENKFFVMIDLITDNINIIHIMNGRPVSHEESSVIGMTDKLAQDFEKCRSSNQIL
ncbi:MAG: hypothetical protein U0T36_12035 [Saprospiraceae bacterium]